MSIKHFFRCLFRVLILIIVHFLKPVVGPGICGAGKYMNSNGVCTDCTAIWSCDAGYYEVRCSANADAYCTSCRSSCTTGYYRYLTCEWTWDHKCSPCEPGYYCPGPFDRYSCNSGETYLPNWYATACTACKSCPSGQYLSPSRTTTEDTGTCTVCNIGSSCPGDRKQYACNPGFTFSSTSGATACTPCSAPCSPGFYQQAPCTTTSDRVCTPCLPGFNFSLTSGATQCLSCSGACPAGTYQQAPCTTTSDRVCTPCVLGSSFSAPTGATACTPCTQALCPSRTIRTQNCTLTSDVVCSQCDEVFVCPEDHYCDD